MSDVEKRGTWSIYNSKGTGIPQAANEMKFTMTFRRQPTGIVDGTDLFEITGFMSDEFTYSSQANYDNIFTPTDLVPKMLADVIHDETQRSFATYGYATKKTWTNNTSQSLTLKWRVVSNSPLEHGWVKSLTSDSQSSDPVVIAKALMSTTMPSVGPNALLNFTSITRELRGVANKLIGIGESKQSNFLPFGSQQQIDPITTLPEAAPVAEKTSNMFSNLSANLFPKHPPICALAIGNIFFKDFMVVKNVELSFSKEFSSPGVPLYADYTVTLDSLFNSSTQSDEDADRIFGSGLSVYTTSRVIDSSKKSESNTGADTATGAKTFTESMMSKQGKTPATTPMGGMTIKLDPLQTYKSTGSVNTPQQEYKHTEAGLGTRLGL